MPRVHFYAFNYRLVTVAHASNSSREFKASMGYMISSRSTCTTELDPVGLPIIKKWYLTVVLLCILLSLLLLAIFSIIRLPWVSLNYRVRPWIPGQFELHTVWGLVSKNKNKNLQVIGGEFLFGWDLKLTAILLPQPLECWNYRCEPPCWIWKHYFEFIFVTCIWVFACIYMLEEDIGSLGTEVTNHFKSPCGCWELILGPWKSSQCS